MFKKRGLATLQILLFGFFVVCFRLTQLPHLSNIDLPQFNTKTQMAQLGELLPRPASSIGDVDGPDFIYDTLVRELPFAYTNRADLIAYTLIEEANKYGLDPLFVLAVIETESHFNPRATGVRGDIGLMQILPETSVWIAHRLKMPAPVDLRDPVMNIKIGTAYLAHLRQHFGSIGNRYLAAYNMGIHNVNKLLKKEREPLIYARRVVRNYRELYQQWGVLIPEETDVIAAN